MEEWRPPDSFDTDRDDDDIQHESKKRREFDSERRKGTIRYTKLNQKRRDGFTALQVYSFLLLHSRTVEDSLDFFFLSFIL